MDAFRTIMNDPRLNGLPIVMETPKQRDDHLAELQLLRSFEGQLRPESPVQLDGEWFNKFGWPFH